MVFFHHISRRKSDLTLKGDVIQYILFMQAKNIENFPNIFNSDFKIYALIKYYSYLYLIIGCFKDAFENL